jgi:hypothetical protein
MRCQGDLKADNTLHPAPERRLPAFDFELLRVQLYGRQSSVRADLLVCSGILGPQLEPALASVCTIGEAVDSKAQVGQDLVIDDVVQEHGIRVEGLLRQDDAIIE